MKGLRKIHIFLVLLSFLSRLAEMFPASKLHQARLCDLLIQLYQASVSSGSLRSFLCGKAEVQFKLSLTEPSKQDESDLAISCSFPQSLHPLSPMAQLHPAAARNCLRVSVWKVARVSCTAVTV